MMLRGSPSPRSCPRSATRSAVAFLQNALSYFASLGIQAQRLMSDNGACYRSRQFAAACRHAGLRHLFTRPYTPKTNGKAERFIQTSPCANGPMLPPTPTPHIAPSISSPGFTVTTGTVLTPLSTTTHRSQSST